MLPVRLVDTMACAGCGLETSPDFAFCPRCGRRQPTPCAACGSSLEADFAFCPRCGAPRSSAAAANKGLPAPAAPARAADEREADRRQVTVLFADLSGFTSLSERARPRGGARVPERPVRDVGAGDRALRRLRREVRRRRGDGGVRRAGRARGRPASAPSTRRSTCCERAERLSRRWAARLGQRVTLAHRRPHRSGRRRQPRRRGRRRLCGDRRHREHDRAPAWRPPRPAQFWCPRRPTR